MPGLHGVVLTSSVTRDPPQDPGSVFAIDLSRITLPTLLINHRDDGCFVAVPADAPRLLEALSRAPAKQALLYDGAPPARTRCAKPCRSTATTASSPRS